VGEALERVGLGGWERRGSHQLSGGEAQRVSLARALVLEPRVLLLDEPLASLDPLLKRHLAVEFASILRDTGTTAVWVTHDQDEALTAADDIAIMRAGSIVASGAAENVASLPQDEWTATFLGVPVAQTGTVVGCTDGLVEVDAGHVSVFMTGDAANGDRVALAVRPEDVILFHQGAEIPPTTARNRLNAVVTGVERRGATDLALLQAGGLRFAASVSRASARELSIEPGAAVLAVFKATAVRWCVLDDTQAQGEATAG
jgi:molybdopterin-binding protein